MATQTPGLTGPDRNAYNVIVALFRSFGLDALAPQILKIVKTGITDAGQVELLLQQTNEWKQRFAGNELRRKAGLSELDPATYLDLENTYDQVLKQYGIPGGMFGRSDFAHWIGGNVSPQEIQDRVQMASKAVNNSDKFFSDALTSLGIDKGHQTAYFLDQSRAEPFLQRQFSAAQIGAAALRNNLGFNHDTALQMASLGVTQDQAEQGYSQIAQQLPRLDQLAQIGGSGFSQSDAEQMVFFGNAEAQARAKKLAQGEQARFNGSAGALSGRTSANSPSLQGAY